MARDTPEPLQAAFDGIEAVLRLAGVRFAFIGALARAAWAEPRATTDVDVQIAVDATEWASLVSRLEQTGFTSVKVTPGGAGESVPDQAFFRAPAGVRVDLLVAKTPFEEVAIARATEADVLGRKVPVVTREDLVVYKTLAGRPRDVADVVAVLDAARLSGAPIDWEYVERWCAAWGVSERLSEIRSLTT
jgi:hypothetical protein